MEEQRKKQRREVICIVIFEYQNQVIFNMTVFNGGPRCHIDTYFWYPNKTVVFGILKASHFQYDALLRERVGRCQTSI